MFDTSCLVALVLVIFRDIFDLSTFRSNSSFIKNNDSGYTFQDMKDLNPDYLKEQFAYGRESLGFQQFSLVFNAIALFAFFVPILQVSWILSDGGKRRVTTLALIFMLTLSGGLCELVVTLMNLGIKTTASWVGRGNFFNLDDWTEDGGDMIGWRVLEIVFVVINGMTYWLNALEWLNIFFIMVILFFTVRAEKMHLGEGAQTFGTKWASFGLAIGFIGLFEFAAELMRHKSWRTYTRVAAAMRSLNMIILIPIYLIVLGRQLPIIKESFEKWGPQEQEQAKFLTPDDRENNEDTI